MKNRINIIFSFRFAFSSPSALGFTSYSTIVCPKRWLPAILTSPTALDLATGLNLTSTTGTSFFEEATLAAFSVFSAASDFGAYLTPDLLGSSGSILERAVV